MTRLIDIHTHLGDLLYPNGGALIEERNVRKKAKFDYLSLMEYFVWPRSRPFRLLYKLLGAKRINRLVIQAGLARNATATRENLRREMDKYQVDYSIMLPVYPKVTFAHLLDAYKKDNALLPFTGVDYDNFEETEGKFARNVQDGARGLKLHPILQRVAANSVESKAAVDMFAPYNLPILLHSGYAYYYLKAEELKLEKPEYGSISQCAELIKAFPHVKFIMGHAGLEEFREVIDRLGNQKNVWVDISFQPPYAIRDLIKTFGVERVLYASDWPWGNMSAPIQAVKIACNGDKQAKQRIYYDNAAELLQLD